MASLELFEKDNGWVCPNGWIDGVTTANNNGPKDPVITDMCEKAKSHEAKFDESLGAHAKLLRPYQKVRTLAAHDYDPEKAAAQVKAFFEECPGDAKEALVLGLLAEPAAEAKDFPVAWSGSSAAHKGKLVADGGNMYDDHLEGYGKMVEMGGGKDKCVVAVLMLAVCSTKEANKAEFSDHQNWMNKFEKSVGSFGRVGVPANRIMCIPFTLDNMETQMDAEECLDMIRKCTLLWCPGGEHYRTMMCLFKDWAHTPEANRGPASKVFATMHECYSQGMAIASTSSGTFTVTGGVLLTGGSSIHTCLKDGSSVDNRGLKNNMEYDPYGGLRLSEGPGWYGALWDAHGPEKNRILRMCRLVMDTKDGQDVRCDAKPTLYAIAVGENTQMCLDRASGWATVQGESYVHLADMQNATLHPHEGAWGIKNVRLSQLSRGDAVNLGTGEIKVADWKKPIQGAGEEVFVSDNILAEPRALCKAVDSLMRSGKNSSTSSSQEGDPKYYVHLERSTEKAALYAGSDPDSNCPFPKSPFGNDWSTALDLGLSIVASEVPV